MVFPEHTGYGKDLRRIQQIIRQGALGKMHMLRILSLPMDTFRLLSMIRTRVSGSYLRSLWSKR